MSILTYLKKESCGAPHTPILTVIPPIPSNSSEVSIQGIAQEFGQNEYLNSSGNSWREVYKVRALGNIMQ